MSNLVVASFSVPLTTRSATKELLVRCQKVCRVDSVITGQYPGTKVSQAAVVTVEALHLFPLIPEERRDHYKRVHVEDILAKMRSMGYRPTTSVEALMVPASGLGWPADPKPGDKQPSPTWISLGEFRTCGGGAKHALSFWTYKDQHCLSDYWVGGGFDDRHLFLAVRSGQ